MHGLTVKLKLESPVLITGVGNGDENSGRTLPYIPGGALRGALIGRYRAAQADLPMEEKAARLFFSGKVRYLNAYPDVRGIRTLPVPASWRTEKNADFDKRTEAYDFALADGNALQTPERVEKTFCRLSDERSAEVLTPARTVSIHIGGEERGIVHEGNNTVFRYEALAARQTFAALIVAEAAQDLSEVKDLLNQSPRLTLGGSRSAGYGHVLIESVEESDSEVSEPEPSDGWVTVTLLSDALLRDGNGQPTLDLDETLSARLGKTIRHARAFVNTAQAGGFNRQWALPLPQGRVLGMGSVFVYPAEEVAADELHALAAEGVGERRVEGFGRFAVNWPGWAELTIKNQIADRPLEPPKRISDESRKLAEAMAGRMLRAWLDEALTAKAPIWQVTGPVPNHQLSRLRAVVRGALMSADKPLALITEYFDEKHMTETARTLFYRARVQQPTSDRLIDWLLERAEKADGLELLGVAKHRAPEVAGQRAAWDEKLQREYTLRLIDAVLRQKMKRNRREEGEA